MRVLHVYSGNLYGGVETLLATLARCRALCPTMEPHFALCFEGRLSRELAHAGVPVHPMGSVRASLPWTVWKARRTLRALLRRVVFDVAVFHCEWPHAVFAPAARSENVPVVFWNHAFLDGPPWLQRWAQRVPPDLTISASRSTLATTHALYPHVRAEYLYYPVALPESTCTESGRAAAREELRTSRDAAVIIQTSRMEAYKGHRLHLEALSHLRDLPNWVCWQVGGAQRPEQEVYVEELRTIATRQGIADRVRFVGEREDVMRLLQAADIHCQPNISPEPFGITFVEALHARRAVVTTAMGGATEIVDETCGILVPPADPCALASALGRLIQDCRLRERLGAAGPARAQRLCNAAVQMARLRDVLASVMVQPEAGGRLASSV